MGAKLTILRLHKVQYATVLYKITHTWEQTTDSHLSLRHIYKHMDSFFFVSPEIK